MIDRVRAAIAAGSPESDQEPDGRTAAVAAVLLPKPWRLLFIRRAETPSDPWSGQMAFPGGRRDPGDQSLRATVLRETLEEVGLDLRNAEFLGAMKDLDAVARGRRMGLKIRPFFFALESPPALTPNYEVADIHWGDVLPMWRGELGATQPWTVEGQVVQFPGYAVGGHVVWGLTYMMLRRFFSALDEVEDPKLGCLE